MDTLVQLLVIVVLTLLEGVFVAAEIALVTMRRTRIDQLADEGNRSASRVKRLIAQPGRFLAVTQIGLTFIGFLASAYAAVNLTTSLKAAFEGTGIAFLVSSAEVLALIIVTLLLSLFTIVFGELVPKSLALAHTERFALGLSGFVELLLRILAPLVYALTAVTTSVSRALGAGDQAQGVMSTEELIDPGRAGRRAGDPRGRGGADDPGGHRARRPAHPRGHGAAHRDGHAGRRRDDGRGDRQGHRRGPQPDPGLRGDDRRDHRDPLCQGPAADPEAPGRRPARRFARSSARRSSCPNR